MASQTINISLRLFQMTSNCDVSSSSSRYSNSNKTQAQSFSVTLAQTDTPISCLTSFMLHTQIIDSGATNHMTGYRCIMSSFTPSFYFVVLADGSRTPIQDIGVATTTSIILLSSIFYLPCFSFNLLLVSKITKVLNCTAVTFSSTHCVFRELRTRKTIGT